MESITAPIKKKTPKGEYFVFEHTENEKPPVKIVYFAFPYSVALMMATWGHMYPSK